MQSVAACAGGRLPAAFLATLPALAQVPVFREIRRNVGYFTFRGGTIGWLNTLDGAVLVDSQYPDGAEALRPELSAASARPWHALINTHHHPDHTEGNKNLRYGSRRIVAHENSAANQRRMAQERQTEDAQEYPDETFTDTWSLDVGDERVVAKYYGPAHTDGDIAITFQNANVVHLGDLVVNHGHPFVDVAYGGTVHGWVNVLEQILADHNPETLYIFGHSGEGYRITGTPADVEFQRDYLSAVIDVATQAVQAGRSREEAMQIQSLPGITDVRGDVQRLGQVVAAAYDEVRAGR